MSAAVPVRSYSTALYLLAINVPLLGATIRDGHVMFMFPSGDVPAGLRAYHAAKAQLDEAETMARVPEGGARC